MMLMERLSTHTEEHLSDEQVAIRKDRSIIAYLQTLCVLIKMSSTVFDCGLQQLHVSSHFIYRKYRRRPNSEILHSTDPPVVCENSLLLMTYHFVQWRTQTHPAPYGSGVAATLAPIYLLNNSFGDRCFAAAEPRHSVEHVASPSTAVRQSRTVLTVAEDPSVRCLGPRRFVTP